jgi:hypothetical protein
MRTNQLNEIADRGLVYILSIQYGDGDWYLYKSKSKKMLIRFREKLRRNAKGTYAHVRRSRIKLTPLKELRGFHLDGTIRIDGILKNEC